jgi:hypothetical protein
VDEKIKAGKKWVDDKKEKVKEKASETLAKMKNFVKNLFTAYTDESGEKHTLKIEEQGGKFLLKRYSLPVNLQVYLDALEKNNNTLNKNSAKYPVYKKAISDAKAKNRSLEKILEKSWNQKNGEDIRQTLAEIASFLKKLPANISKNKGAVPEVKEIIWNTNTSNYSLKNKNGSVIANLSSVDGMSVNVPLLSINSKKYIGSEPSSAGSSAFWKIMNSSKIQFNNRVRGHILNHQLFGTGADVKNLGPIPIAANNDMKTNFENAAKEAVHGGEVLGFSVSYTYGKPNDSTGRIEKHFPGIKLPVRVSFDVEKKTFKGDEASAKTDEVDNPAKWKTSGTLKKGSIKINHDDFF